MKNLKNSLGAVIAILFFAAIFSYIYTSTQTLVPYTENIKTLAQQIFGPYVLAFELLSVLLVIAMLGALYLAERGDKE